MREMIAKAAKDGAKKYASEELELLKYFSTIDCGTNDEHGNKQVVEKLKTILNTMAVTIEERYFEHVGTHLIVRIKPENASGKILFLAHLDTVFSAGDTKTHPFHIEGDWAYGLGIADCKGGVVASLYAVKIMQEAGLLPHKEIVLLYTCDEEYGSPTGRIIFQEEAENADMAFVFEPARGENGILTERKGICAYKVSVAGKTAHQGLAYKEGRSAVIELAYQTVSLYEKNNEELSIFYNISDISGGSESGGIPEYAHATVSTTIGSVDAIAQIQKDIKEIEEHVFIDGCKNTVVEEICHPYMAPTAENKKLYHMLKAAGELIGQDLPEESTSGASDANLIAGYGLPVVCGLGPYMKNIHTFQEGLLIPTIEEKTALTAALLGIMDTF